MLILTNLIVLGHDTPPFMQLSACRRDGYEWSSIYQQRRRYICLWAEEPEVAGSSAVQGYQQNVHSCYLALITSLYLVLLSSSWHGFLHRCTRILQPFDFPVGVDGSKIGRDY